MDHFEVFALPRRLGLDEADLRRRFHELSRRHHPDFHHGADPGEQTRILETAARINAAYRTLRDPIRRVEYLLRLEGGEEAGEEAGEGRAPKADVPADLLTEMFEIQETLEEAKSGSLDEPGRDALRAQRAALERRCGEEEARLRGPLSEAWDGAGEAERPRVRAACRAALATRAYLRTVIDDLALALGEGQEPHVAHHRH
jgi:molecular chaperone HscB